MKKINVAAVAALGLVASGSALAVAQDYSGVATAVTQEITAAITTGLPLFGLVLGVFLAVRIIRRFAKG